MPHGKCMFKKDLMLKDEYKIWLKPGKTAYSAMCIACNSSFSVGNGSPSAVLSHHNGKTHKDNVEAFKSAQKGLAPLFYRKIPAASASSSSAVSSSSAASSPSVASSSSPKESNSTAQVSSRHTLDNLVSQKKSIIRAEIIWVLRVVKNHSSFRSCLELGDDLKEMFQNDQTVAGFKLSKTKCCYLVAPWVKMNLKAEINKSPFFGVSFDESLNNNLQQNQMDIQIRFWSEEDNKAVTRYWGSEFQLRTDADTLVASLSKALEKLPLQKQHHLGMDGPSTNWKILDILKTMREKAEYPPLEEIGSCGLHIISGALHTGVVSGVWPIEKLLRGMFKFLHNSPARRAEYLRVSSTGLFPEKFCATRWVENETVANRAIEIWEDYVKLIKVFISKCPSKQPKDNKSYDNLKEYHSNPLIMLYLHLFRDVSSRLNVFLVKFQTDAPMVPFLSEEIAGILKWLMGFFIQKEVLKNHNSPYNLSKLSIDEKNWRLKTDIKLTTSAAKILKNVRPALHQGLLDSWRKFLIGMVKKIQGRSPINSKLVRLALCLNPVKMAELDMETEQSLFDGIVDIMYLRDRMTSKQADCAKEQFNDFLQKVVMSNKNEFLDFNMKDTRVDEFLGFYVNPKAYPDFWMVCKFVFTLNHGQSAVERGFNVNKQTVVDNLKEVSLTSLRTVYDEIIQHENIRRFPIDNALILSCQTAGTKYKQELQQKRDATQNVEKSLKRKNLGEELLVVKKKKVDLEDLAKELDTDADRSLMEANEIDDVTEMRKLVAKASSFKKSAKEKRESAGDMVETIKKMEEELSSLGKK